MVDLACLCVCMLGVQDGTQIPFGLMVWSTGIKQLPLVQELQFPKHKNGRLMTDDWLRLFESDRIFAVGDCAAHHAHPLPALAQVAQQQGAYLGKLFNSEDVTRLPPALPAPSSVDATSKDTKNNLPQHTVKPPLVCNLAAPAAAFSDFGSLL